MNIFKNYFSEFVRFRFLISELVKRDLTVKYKRSVLGMLWSVLQPLMIMIVMVVIFSQIFRNEIKFFPVYILIGKIMWDLFSQTTMVGMNSILDSSNLIKKVYIPKYIFPLAKSVSAVVNLLLSMVGLFVIIIVTGVPLHFSMVMIIFPIFYLFLFSLGLSYILATYVVFFRDLNYLFEVVLTAWMYFSALFYPVSILGDYAYILEFNPVYRMISMFRDIIISNQLPSLSDHLIALAIGLITIAIGLFALKKNQDRFILYF